MSDVEVVKHNLVEIDAEGNTTLTIDGDLHIVTNGDFLVTANGEMGLLSKTAINLDCALLLFNSRLCKQIRQMKQDLRLQFIDMLGGMPNLTTDQKVYLKVTKERITELLELEETELSYLEQEE